MKKDNSSIVTSLYIRYVYHWSFQAVKMHIYVRRAAIVNQVLLVLLCNVRMSNNARPDVTRFLPFTTPSTSSSVWFSSVCQELYRVFALLDCVTEDKRPFLLSYRTWWLASVSEWSDCALWLPAPRLCCCWWNYLAVTLSAYTTVQRLQPLELFHGISFLLRWLNLRLFTLLTPGLDPKVCSF